MNHENDLENLLVNFVDGLKRANAIADSADDDEFTICVMEAYQCGLHLETLIRDLLRAVRTEYGITKADIAKWLEDTNDDEKGPDASVNTNGNAGINEKSSLHGNADQPSKKSKSNKSKKNDDDDEYDGPLPTIPEREDNTEPVIEIKNPMDKMQEKPLVKIDNEYNSKLESQKNTVVIANPLEASITQEPKKPKPRRGFRTGIEAVGIAKIMTAHQPT